VIVTLASQLKIALDPAEITHEGKLAFVNAMASAISAVVAQCRIRYRI